jgi:hypothetical protein
MSVSKRINTGDYVVTTNPTTGNPDGDVFFYTNTFNIFGNLSVTGTNLAVDAVDTVNQIFHVNADLFAPDPPASGYSGLENRRGTDANVGIYWDEDGSNAGEWIANNSVGNLGPILTSYNVKIEKAANTNPTASASFIVMTGAEPDAGGTGLYVNAGVSSSEIVSIPGARRLAIIFGG